MRRAFVLVGLLFAASPAAAADARVSLAVDPAVARYDALVSLAATFAPSAAGQPVEIVSLTDGTVVASGVTGSDGVFRASLRARAPATYAARGGAEESAPVTLRVRPILAARLVRRPALGRRVTVAGRLTPAAAGRLSFRLGRRSRSVAVGETGAFRASLPLADLRTRSARLALRPREDWIAVRRVFRFRPRLPALALGSRDPAVRVLEQRLSELRYAVRRVDARYGHDTYEAVLAFQKVRRLARSGRVGRGVWRGLRRARLPLARVARGDHLEVDKTRQVLFEVRRGRVARVVHVSTGATGNTPVGRWRVYWMQPGYSAIGMYDSLYFLRGFAIHGYHSVPPYPASHGCVRVPIWQAPGIFARWGLGSVVRVFP